MNFCRDCRYLSDTAKGRPPSHWACFAAPNDEIDLVSGEVYPYLLCHVVRRRTGEDCPLFEQAANCLHPKEVA